MLPAVPDSVYEPDLPDEEVPTPRLLDCPVLVLVRHTFQIESMSESDLETFRAGVTGAAKALAAETGR
jgi:hypothetical protein